MTLRYPDGRQATARIAAPSPQREVAVSYEGDLRGLELWPHATASGIEAWADYARGASGAEVDVQASGLFDYWAQ